MKKAALLATVILLVSQSLLAADKAWFGTWKLNRDKSQFTGETFTLTKVSDGAYHFEEGALSFDIYEDGQDHPTIDSKHASNLTKTGSSAWLRVMKVNGIETSRSAITLSDDGNVMTYKTTGKRADGSSYTSESVEDRVGSDTGIAGTWKNTKQTSSAEDIVIVSDAGGGKVKWEFPASKGSYISTPDGKPALMTGPRAAANEQVVTTVVSHSKLNFVQILNDQPFVVGTDTLSADGKVMTEVSWVMTKPDERTTAIYEKQ